jgi:phosphatidylserine decarboxylase
MTGSGWLLLQVLKALPKNALSRVVGRLAALRLPRRLARRAVVGFGRVFGVDFSEVRDPIDSFDSIQSFFTRALAEGARPLDPASEAFLYPCDGAWGHAGCVEDGQVFQLKGRPYRLAALLGSAERAKAFEGGQFATLYLSPRDYHRFHAPCDADVERVDYIPGALWPVNRIGVEGIEGLFAENERLCVYLSPRGSDGVRRTGAAAICLVAVGATIVGKTRLTFDELSTNVKGARAESRVYGHDEIRLDRGQEFGRFEFGSTIIVLVPKDGVYLDLQSVGSTTRMGRRMGVFDA